MGFPVGYTELMLPRFVIHIIFILGHIRRFITWAFDVVGLGDLIDSPDIPYATVFPPLSDHHDHRQGQTKTNKPLYAVLIQDLLPSVKYDDLEDEGKDLTDSCAVCLHEFEGQEEVRRLSNCRHVFHKNCLDPWVELDQRTCPLCRTLLVPEEMKEEINRKLNPFVADAGDGSIPPTSSHYYDDYYVGGGDYFDDSFVFMLPSQVEPFSWIPSSTSSSSSSSLAAAATL